MVTLSPGDGEKTGPKLFRFLTYWKTRPYFQHFLVEVWHTSEVPIKNIIEYFITKAMEQCCFWKYFLKEKMMPCPIGGDPNLALSK